MGQYQLGGTFLVACHGTLALALASLTALIIYQWVKREDVLIKFAVI